VERIRGQERSSQAAAQVNVSVEGNLSEAEVADIQKLIQTFGQVTQGQATTSQLATQFGSLDSLATAKLSYNATDQVNYGSVRVYA
jgi:hypothetical protein